MGKIKFTAISSSWSEGGVLRISIKASVESEISIAWGDGFVTKRTFHNGSEIEFEHDYCPNNSQYPSGGLKFQVEISAENPDGRIIGFSRLGSEINASDLDVSNCPELENLFFFGSTNYDEEPGWRLDLSRNPALKQLNCSNWNFNSLNLSHNPALEELNCNFNRLSHLSLTNNSLLKKLNCEWNKMEQLFIVYAPHLCEAEFEEGNNIDEATKMQIQELIENNNRSF